MFSPTAFIQSLLTTTLLTGLAVMVVLHPTDSLIEVTPVAPPVTATAAPSNGPPVVSVLAAQRDAAPVVGVLAMR